MTLLSDRVHTELKRRLIRWEYLPRERLIEEKLAEEFEVSRTPVREALRRLEREGFAEHKSWYGYRALRPDLPRIQEHYEIRLLLEGATVRKLAENLRPGQLDQLLDEWSPTGSGEVALDASQVYVDEAFHESLARLAGNQTLLKMLRSINEHIRIVRSGDFVTQERIARTYRQHRGILLAIRREDPDLAAARMTAHIQESRELVGEVAARALSRILHGDASGDGVRSRGA